MEKIVSNFCFYFEMGWQHIMIFDAIDHHLYLLSLILLFDFKDFKKILILITAFTIGHFFSMLLSVSQLVNLPTRSVEFLIALSIFISSIYNLIIYVLKLSTPKLSFLMPLIFGFIHGMGFSVVLEMILNDDDNYLISFFGFNFGVEISQLIIVLCLILVSILVKYILKFPTKLWVYSCSLILIFYSIKIMIERM